MPCSSFSFYVSGDKAQRVVVSRGVASAYAQIISMLWSIMPPSGHLIGVNRTFSVIMLNVAKLAISK